MERKMERALPAVVEQYPVAPFAPPFALEAEREEPAVPLPHYLWIVRRHRWRILAFVGASVLATLIVSSRLTPIYESTATVDVDRQTPTGVIGQEAVRSTSNDADQFLATQVKLIQSDSVLRPVVEKYNLTEDLEDVSSAGNLKPTWVNNGRARRWNVDAEGQGRDYLRRATQVKNIWVPYGE